MRQIVTTTYCDMCGKEPAELVAVAPGKEADLCSEHKQLLETALAPFLAISRKSGAAQVRPQHRTFVPKPAAKTAVRSSVPPSQAAIRAWAQANGYPVAPRGRIAQNVLEKYESAHS